MDKDIIVKQSQIHKIGVFANRTFKKGEVVLKWDITRTISDQEIAKLCAHERMFICKIDEKFILMQEPERYVNHSCNPNTNSKDFCDIAVREIRKGEEITTDYSTVASGGPRFKCNCGCKNCKKEIKS